MQAYRHDADVFAVIMLLLLLPSLAFCRDGNGIQTDSAQTQANRGRSDEPTSELFACVR